MLDHNHLEYMGVPPKNEVGQIWVKFAILSLNCCIVIESL